MLFRNKKIKQNLTNWRFLDLTTSSLFVETVLLTAEVKDVLAITTRL